MKRLLRMGTKNSPNNRQNKIKKELLENEVRIRWDIKGTSKLFGTDDEASRRNRTLTWINTGILETQFTISMVLYTVGCLSNLWTFESHETRETKRLLIPILVVKNIRCRVARLLYHPVPTQFFGVIKDGKTYTEKRFSSQINQQDLEID